MAAKPFLVFVAKWLLVPILFGLLGYYVVGPMVNSSTPATKQSPQAEEPEVLATQPTASRKFTGEPAVEVVVEKPKKSNKIRSAPKRKPAAPAKEESPAPPAEPTETPEEAPASDGA